MAGEGLKGDLIGYRGLTRTDFQGKEAPPAFAAVKDRVGAATCARIVSDPPAQIEIQSLKTPGGDATFTARITTIGYRALMDRDCSWWNDEASGQDPAYVLEHEQIHFALFELEARRLTREARELAAELRVTGDSQDDVRQEVEAAIRDLFEESTEGVMERNRDFDEDTSLGYEPKRQKEWLATVKEELAELK